MTTKTQTLPETGGFLFSEAEGTRAREQVTLDSGQVLDAGTVLGQITVGGNYSIYDPGNADGTETAVAVLYGDTDASGGDADAVIIARDAEVNAGELRWFAGASGPQIATGQGDLALVGIIAR